MTTVNIRQAKTPFSRLIEQAVAGEEILIATTDRLFRDCGARVIW
jgi:antitoxin (DNA-binding transcriptional repressor) of toxin-antitoxin stability system